MANKKQAGVDRFKQQTGGRREAFRQERRYYLIVCEGKKTEPNYFESLKNKLEFDGPARVEIKIFGEGHNTKSLVEKAIERKNEIERDSTRRVDKIWVVFDRDSFEAGLFNAAIQACNRKDIEIAAAWSNEAFELWYLLHFEFYQSALSRGEYKVRIEKHFKKAGYKDFRYEKNHPNMFNLLGDERLQVAIKNAKKLVKMHNGKTHADQNPCTKVHELVIELFGISSE
jgi:hypothetical protein